MIIPEKLRREIDACPKCQTNKKLIPKATDAFCLYHGEVVFGDSKTKYDAPQIFAIDNIQNRRAVFFDDDGEVCNAE